jgi:pyruvate kinase
MRISRFRPSVAIIGLCYSKELAKKLSLCYAVTPVYLNKKMESINESIRYCGDFAKKNKYKVK